MADTFNEIPLEINEEKKLVTSSDPSTDLTNLNSLYRHMSALTIPVPPPPNQIHPARSTHIQRLKDSGNAAFKASPPDYASAHKFYTIALSMALDRAPWEHHNIAREEMAIMYANRAAANLGAERWPEALADSCAVIELKKPWTKGHFRKGKALEEMGRWKEAREAYAFGLQFEPESEELKNALKELEKKEKK
ncbi:hypothetical protein YB2330_000352 [Saitoella coloradoensis]